jgi:nucleotide-binding universal stress UspA family protein
MANAFSAPVTVLWVTPPVDTVSGVPVASEERWRAEYDREAGPYLARIESHLREAGAEVSVERASGVPRQIILDRAASLNADLILMTTHGRSGIRRLALGSVAEDVLRHAECAVLLIRAKEA